MENICSTCFTHGRQLYPVNKMLWLIHETYLSELLGPEYSICWECRSVISKFYKFRTQVKKLQRILKENIMPQDLKPQTALLSTTKHTYDYELQHTDPLTTVDSDKHIQKENYIHIEINELSHTDRLEDENVDIKEQVFAECPDYNCDEVDSITEEVNTNENVQKNIKKRLKNSSVRKVRMKVESDDEVKEKFEKIVLTEEEMVQHREEKRNQPNFKKIPYKCNTCVLGFTRKENYDLHMEKKHNESIGQFTCTVCQICFPSNKTAERHKRKHYVCYRCRLCKYETVELWSAVNHCRSKHSGDSKGCIHCGQCQFVARTPEDLCQHMKSEHTLSCDECGEKFKGKNTLRTHKSRIHATPREFVCDICTKTFVSKSRLESHLVSHNAALAHRLSYCETCDLQYRNIHAYRTHLRNSARHANTPYPCPECNKKFASKVYWKKHYNFYHLRKSQFHCEICNKLFISDWRLKNHRQKHHGLSRNRDHACNVCGKRFYTISTLRGHLLTHSEQRSYMCAECGDTFKQRPALYTHARLLHRHTR